MKLKYMLFSFIFLGLLFTAKSFFLQNSNKELIFEDTVTFSNDVVFEAGTCSTACPDPSTVSCLQPVVNSCGDYCGMTGLAKSIEHCLQNFNTTLCGEVVKDDCGNSCDLLGTFCETYPSICFQSTGDCLPLIMYGSQQNPAASCQAYFDMYRPPSGHRTVWVQMAGLNDGKMTQVDCYSNATMFSGAWMLVRRRSSIATTWHPVHDNLEGSASYGTYVPDPLDVSQAGFSLAFNAVPFTNILLVSGNHARFLVAPKESFVPITVSTCTTPSVMLSSDKLPLVQSSQLWCRRMTHPEDPGASSNCDHHSCGDGPDQSLLYFEDGYPYHWADVLHEVGGYNVYIK
eukprot:GCRY01001415.1.p1 GENE.GCRY01001415.1~~GCRY01001415.1.p1  ORF type:complete len:360 (+),score=28.69 GCRY01001415.1:50-1081(+)